MIEVKTMLEPVNDPAMFNCWNDWNDWNGSDDLDRVTI